MSDSIRRNTGTLLDHRIVTHFDWREFDLLPKTLRDLINYAPTPVGTGYVFEQLNSGAHPDRVAALAAARWRGYARQEVLKLYGPSHPQAV